MIDHFLIDNYGLQYYYGIETKMCVCRCSYTIIYAYITCTNITIKFDSIYCVNNRKYKFVYQFLFRKNAGNEFSIKCFCYKKTHFIEIMSSVECTQSLRVRIAYTDLITAANLNGVLQLCQEIFTWYFSSSLVCSNTHFMKCLILCYDDNSNTTETAYSFSFHFISLRKQIQENDKKSYPHTHNNGTR